MQKKRNCTTPIRNQTEPFQEELDPVSTTLHPTSSGFRIDWRPESRANPISSKQVRDAVAQKSEPSPSERNSVRVSVQIAPSSLLLVGTIQCDGKTSHFDEKVLYSNFFVLANELKIASFAENNLTKLLGFTIKIIIIIN